jgi:GntR family transcriptional regulator, transcriptional repressor for pyruvate dehydrogenase complex
MPRVQMRLPNLSRTEKLSARVSREIENAIVSDGLEPLARLPTESELCRSFGVSRTVVREALQHLTARGLVRSVAGSGSYVASSSVADLERCLALLSRNKADRKAFLELLDLRLLVETELAGRVAKAPPPACVAAMRAAVAQMKASLSDSEAFARSDTSFHRAILDGAGHALFGAILKPLSPLAHRYGVSTYDSKSTLRVAIREHQAILRQIEAEDPAGARKAMSDHLTSSREHYLLLLGQLDEKTSSPRKRVSRRQKP